MKVAEIKQKAGLLGIKAANMKKAELIHAIQKAEGNNPCFGTAKDSCPYTNCCFMKDCLRKKA